MSGAVPSAQETYLLGLTANGFVAEWVSDARCEDGTHLTYSFDSDLGKALRMSKPLALALNEIANFQGVPLVPIKLAAAELSRLMTA